MVQVKSSKSERSSAKKAVKILFPNRERMISEAAYYIAESREFSVGHDMHDWLQAEKRINAMLGGQA